MLEKHIFNCWTVKPTITNANVRGPSWTWCLNKVTPGELTYLNPWALEISFVTIPCAIYGILIPFEGRKMLLPVRCLPFSPFPCFHFRFPFPGSHSRFHFPFSGFISASRFLVPIADSHSPVSFPLPVFCSRFPFAGPHFRFQVSVPYFRSIRLVFLDFLSVDCHYFRCSSLLYISPTRRGRLTCHSISVYHFSPSSSFS